jgi:hypothetical protein
LLFGELVGVLNLGCGFTIEIGRRLDVEGIICPEVFSILKCHFWIAHAFHSSIAAEALAGRLAAQREPSACVSATFVVEKNQSWSIWHGVGQVSLRWVTLSSTSMRFVRIWEMSSDCHVRRGIRFVSVEMIIWFLGTFRVMNRRIKYSLMKSLDISRYLICLLESEILFWALCLYWSLGLLGGDLIEGVCFAVKFSLWRRMLVSVDKETFLCAQMVKCGLRWPRLRADVNILHCTGLVYSRLCGILGHTG